MRQLQGLDLSNTQKKKNRKAVLIVAREKVKINGL